MSSAPDDESSAGETPALRGTFAEPNRPLADITSPAANPSTPTEILGPLAGARIALTGTRKAQETAEFVARLGGIPIVAPTLSTSTVDPGLDATPRSTDDSVDADGGARDVVSFVSIQDVGLYIFLTGVGARALFRAAEAQGTYERLRANLERASVVVRGPKALGALKGAGFRVDWMPAKATVEEILAGLDRFEVRGRIVVVQLSGFSDSRLRDALESRGASVIELDLYWHEAPENEAVVLNLIDQIEADTVDFLTFTSAIGVREFFGVAERHEREDDLLAALRVGPTITAAVGTVTAAALVEAGVTPQIVPDIPTTGGMLRAIGDWIALHPR